MQLPKFFTTVTPISKLLAAILFITFPLIGFYLGMQYQKGITLPIMPFSKDIITIVPSNIPTVIPTMTATGNSEMIFPTSTNPNLKRFVSKSLGITFTYLEKQDISTYTTKEIDNRVYIHNKIYEPSSGQYIEVFQKEKTETLSAAIKRQFLADYSDKDCFVVDTTSNYKKSGYPISFTMEEISFPKDTSDPNQPWWANSDKCPSNYSQSNGISYFLEDKNHPERYTFFSIGQYGIFSEENKQWNKEWKDTIEFF